MNCFKLFCFCGILDVVIISLVVSVISGTCFNTSDWEFFLLVTFWNFIFSNGSEFKLILFIVISANLFGFFACFTFNFESELGPNLGVSVGIVRANCDIDSVVIARGEFIGGEIVDKTFDINCCKSRSGGLTEGIVARFKFDGWLSLEVVGSVDVISLRLTMTVGCCLEAGLFWVVFFTFSVGSLVTSTALTGTWVVFCFTQDEGDWIVDFKVDWCLFSLVCLVGVNELDVKVWNKINFQLANIMLLVNILC